MAKKEISWTKRDKQILKLRKEEQIDEDEDWAARDRQIMRQRRIKELCRI